MKETEVFIVGAGPAGSTCARILKENGIDFILADKSPFPRDKPCAGWISPPVFKIIKKSYKQYPYTIHLFKRIIFHFPKWTLPISTLQFSIRREEFDYWLLESAGIVPILHKVENIQKENDYFIIDNQFKARVLIGAGGTHCPVRKKFFDNSSGADPMDLIIGLAAETANSNRLKDSHLWFFEHGISGYSWILPKNRERVNIGIGARIELLKEKGENIKDHWNLFIQKLLDKKWISEIPSPRGHYYYLQNPHKILYKDNVYLIGDSARLSTLDMGEGIFNAMQSGKIVAESIAGGKTLSSKGIAKYSFPGILFERWMKYSTPYLG